MSHTAEPVITPNVVIESAVARKVIYAAVGAVGLLLACLNVGFGYAITQDTSIVFPLWLGISNAVYPVLGAGIGYTASRNTPQ